jgi:hypothetical protein
MRTGGRERMRQWDVSSARDGSVRDVLRGEYLDKLAQWMRARAARDILVAWVRVVCRRRSERPLADADLN